MLAVSCGLVVANLYYAQPLAGPIGAALGMSPGSAGLIVTLTQIGYGAGLLLIVPLADLVENRRLVVILLGVSALALLGAALATHPAPFLLASLCIGLGSVAVQVLVPYASHMVPEAIRGRVVGNLMSGLMLGIMLARPVASTLAQVASWHAVFVLSAVVMLGVAAVLAAKMPRRQPDSGQSYAALLTSMVHLARRTKVLQRRALYHAGLFCAFSLFWTTVPLLLAGPVYRLSQGGIALFALVGVAGAVAAPLGGRLADRGWTRPGTVFCLLAGSAAFLLTRLTVPGSSVSLGLLALAAIVLDFGVAGNMTLGQRAIFVLGPELRGRLNGLFMATFFMAGAAGSAIGAWSYAKGGWALTSWIGFALPLVAFAYFLTEPRPARP
ncbi:MAG: MFS transporter [Janthinobacterium lividum]